MAVWSEISCSRIILEQRADAEFFKPEYKTLERLLTKIQHSDRLGELVNYVKKGIFDISPLRYKMSGIPLIRTSQIKNPIGFDNNLTYISEEDHRIEFSKTELLSGDIVLTKIGAGIGDVAILSKKFKRYNFSQNVAGLSINKQKIDSHYLLCYLISSSGKGQILRYMMPSGQGKLELRDIKKIIIPRVGSIEIELAGILKKSEKILQHSIILSNQAQKLLEQELGLDKPRFKILFGYETSYSEIINGHRIDSQCYNPDCVNYEKYLKRNFDCKSLRTLLKSMVKGKQMTTHLKGLFPYVSIKDIDGLELLSDSFCTLLNGIQIAKKEDLLLAITGATIGKIGIVNRYERLAFSGDLLKLEVCDDINPYYLLTVMQNPIGQRQCSRWITGSTNGHLSPIDVGKIIIPRLQKKKEEEIAYKIVESLKAKKESKDLLEKAKQKVEELIEQAAEKT